MSDGKLGSARSDPYGHGHRISARNTVPMCGHRMRVGQAACCTLTGLLLLGNVGLGLVLRFDRASTFDPFHLFSTPVTDCAGSFGSGTPFLDAFSVLVTPNQATLATDPLTLGVRGWIWGVMGDRSRCRDRRGLWDCGCRRGWRRRSGCCDGWCRESG